MADIASTFRQHYLLDSFHDHLPKRLILIFESLVNFFNNLDDSHFPAQLHSGLDQLFVVALLNRHSSNPEASEEFFQNLLPNVVGLDSVATDNLFQHLKHNFSHFLFWVLKLPDQSWHDGFGILGGVFGIHKGNDESDRLQECAQ